MNLRKPSLGDHFERVFGLAVVAVVGLILLGLFLPAQASQGRRPVSPLVSIRVY